MAGSYTGQQGGAAGGVPAHHHHAGEHRGGEQRGDDAHGDGDGEAADGAGAEHEKHHMGQEGGRVAVDNGAVGAAEAVFERRHRLAVEPGFFADALVDQDVSVHGHAEGEQDAGHAGQGEGGFQQGQDGQHHDQVHHQGDVRDPAEQAVEGAHEADDQQEAHAERDAAGADAVSAEFGTDCALLDDGEGGGQRTGA